MKCYSIQIIFFAASEHDAKTYISSKQTPPIANYIADVPKLDSVPNFQPCLTSSHSDASSMSSVSNNAESISLIHNSQKARTEVSV